MHIRLKERLYADEIVNRGRQIELDGAKFIAIFFLALIHCTIECIPEEQLVSGIPYLLDTVIGGPLAAPLYMFAMGVCMVYTQHDRPEDYMRRGLRLFILNYVLNVCRFLIPFLMGYLIVGDYDKYIQPLFYLVMQNDILMFAGISMLLIGLFTKWKISDGVLLGIALVFSILGSWLAGTDVQNPLGNVLLGYLIGTEDAAGMVRSCFPLFNWFIVPVCGYLFGKKLLHLKNKPLFYGIFSSVALVITVIYFYVGITNEWGMFGEGQNCYYHAATPDVLASISAALAALGIWYVLVQILPSKMQSVIVSVSRNITAVYFIHWVIISLTINVALYAVRGTQELSVTTTVLLGTAISIISMVLAHFWNKCKKKHTRKVTK